MNSRLTGIGDAIAMVGTCGAPAELILISINCNFLVHDISWPSRGLNIS